MKDISASKIKENHIIYMGHFNFYVMEVSSTSGGDIIVRGCYHEPFPDDYPSASQILGADDIVTVY